jgi:hypothetical protein
MFCIDMTSFLYEIIPSGMPTYCNAHVQCPGTHYKRLQSKSSVTTGTTTPAGYENRFIVHAF